MEFEYEQTVKEKVCVLEWAGKWLPVFWEGAKHGEIYSHESLLPEELKTLCPAAYDYAVWEIRKNRPLAENEARTPDGQIRILSVEGEDLVASGPFDNGRSVYSRQRLVVLRDGASRWRAYWQHCLDYYDRHAPLEADQTWNWKRTKRGKMSIDADGKRLHIDWEDGQVSKECPGAWGQQPERQAFFEKHAPPPLAKNEFRDEEGRLWTFEMQDDGEVEATFEDLINNTRYLHGTGDWSRAALAYRDRERARWTFERFKDYNAVQVNKDGRISGAHDDHGWSMYPGVPTWVRDRARKEWEAMQETETECQRCACSYGCGD